MTSDEGATGMVAPVVVLAYDGVAADEAGIIVQILAKAGLRVIVATVGSDPVTSFHGRVVAEASVDELAKCSALVVPGGMGVQSAADNGPFISAINDLASDALWLGATSTGSVLLASAGVVDGARATTHWLAGDLITTRGLTLVKEPFVEHGRLLTASGAASAVTLALRLVGALVGVEAERQARDSVADLAVTDPRYGPRVRGWRRFFGAKRLTPVGHPIDPEGDAEIVVLDLDAET